VSNDPAQETHPGHSDVHTAGGLLALAPFAGSRAAIGRGPALSADPFHPGASLTLSRKLQLSKNHLTTHQS
jgi:hypothetical protein